MAEILLYQRDRLPPSPAQTAKPSYAAVTQRGQVDFGNTVAAMASKVGNDLIQARATNEIHEFMGLVSSAQENFRGELTKNPNMSFDDMKKLKERLALELSTAGQKLTVPASKHYASNWMVANRGTLLSKADTDIHNIISQHETQRFGLVLDNYLTAGNLAGYEKAIDDGAATGLIWSGIAEQLKEQGRTKLAGLTTAQNIDKELARARQQFDITGDELTTLDIIRNSAVIPEDKKQELQEDLYREINIRRDLAAARAKQTAKAAEDEDLTVLSRAYITGSLDDLESGLNYLKTAPGLTPEAKVQWVDKFTARIKAIQTDGPDPLKEYDPTTYTAFLKRSLNETLTKQELINAVGKGRQGGISDSQFKYFVDQFQATPEQKTMRVMYMGVLKGITYSPIAEYDNLLYAQAATYLDEWAVANPKATAEDYEGQIKKIISISKNTKGIGNAAEYQTRQAELKKLRSDIYKDIETKIRSYYPRLNEENKARAEEVIHSQDPERMKQTLSILGETYRD